MENYSPIDITIDYHLIKKKRKKISFIHFVEEEEKDC